MPGEFEHWSTVLQALKSPLSGRRPTEHAPRVPGLLGALRSRRTARYVAQGSALVAIVAGTVVVASYDKAVSLTVDGHTSSVHAFASNVGDVLESKGITVGPHDLVSPAPSTSVHDGEHLVVRYGRQLRLDVDGTPQTYWTTALTVDQALTQIGLRGDGSALSVSRDAPLGRQGLGVTMTTPKDVKIKVDGKTVDQITTAATVGVLLEQEGITLGAEDTLSVPVTTELTPGLALTVTRIHTLTKTVSAKVHMPVKSTKNAKLARGTTKVITKGHAGRQKVTYELVYKNGKLAKKTKVAIVVVRAAVTQVVQVGTKAAAGSTGSAGDPGAQGGSAASLNWAALARCESGGNPKAVNPSGYYGLYQFSLATWRSVGGTGNPINASASEQTHRAEILYNKAGAGQWTCGHHLFD